ncbi:uncharacterized protein LOC123652375 [Pipistrellus kuhlii]|uniref:uncharacterized protein LOC123652375 n=1 Tax=Pipistrellus kuhlii TaxID=59472 RepID=UPI001E272C7A|nr:uncharacterized protein LOC123652375 [Pipistrellus kuhlii]
MIQARHLHFPNPLLLESACLAARLSPRGPGGSEGREREGFGGVGGGRKEARTAVVQARGSRLEDTEARQRLWQELRGEGAPPGETERDLARGREARALLAGREGTRSARNVREEARRGARTLARGGRAHLPARGARPPRARARARAPGCPRAAGPVTPRARRRTAERAGTAGGRGAACALTWRWLPARATWRPFPTRQCPWEPRLALRLAFLHGEVRRNSLYPAHSDL